MSSRFALPKLGVLRLDYSAALSQQPVYFNILIYRSNKIPFGIAVRLVSSSAHALHVGLPRTRQVLKGKPEFLYADSPHPSFQGVDPLPCLGYCPTPQRTQPAILPGFSTGSQKALRCCNPRSDNRSILEDNHIDAVLGTEIVAIGTQSSHDTDGFGHIGFVSRSVDNQAVGGPIGNRDGAGMRT
jgi:hypothetical protein